MSKTRRKNPIPIESKPINNVLAIVLLTHVPPIIPVNSTAGPTTDTNMIRPMLIASHAMTATRQSHAHPENVTSQYSAIAQPTNAEHAMTNQTTTFKFEFSKFSRLNIVNQSNISTPSLMEASEQSRTRGRSRCWSRGGYRCRTQTRPRSTNKPPTTELFRSPPRPRPCLPPGFPGSNTSKWIGSSSLTRHALS